jgi:hypothetical protein
MSKADRPDRISLHEDKAKRSRITKEAEADLAHLQKARELAEQIAGKVPESLTGQEEVKNALQVEGYPSASLSAAANLHGVVSEYKAYTDAVAKVGDLSRYKLSNGEAVINPKWLEQLRDSTTSWLSGERKDAYLELQHLCEVFNDARNELGLNLSNILWINANGYLSMNTAQFLAASSRRS